jgi:phage/plasmid primase-like uncharacterized protein
MVRLARGEKCCVCQKVGWCMRTVDGDKVLCMRMGSDRPYTFKATGETGYIHRLTDTKKMRKLNELDLQQGAYLSSGEVTEYYQKLCGEMAGLSDLVLMANKLGLPAEWLQAVGCVRDKSKRSWCFPMQDGQGKITGLRYRSPSGSKFSLAGGKEGIFLPIEPLPNSIYRLCICEGPTSLAALTGWGFHAIGRPNCMGGQQQLDSFLRRHDVQEIYIWGDNDPKKVLPDGTVYYPGQDGMRNLQKYLAQSRSRVYAYVPPWKDARDWEIRKHPLAVEVMDNMLRFREECCNGSQS